MQVHAKGCCMSSESPESDQGSIVNEKSVCVDSQLATKSTAEIFQRH